MVFSKGLFGSKLTRGVLKKLTGRPPFAVTFSSWKKRCSHRGASVAPFAKPTWLALKERWLARMGWRAMPRQRAVHVEPG
jgi:hypothetical protein